MSYTLIIVCNNVSLALSFFLKDKNMTTCSYLYIEITHGKSKGKVLKPPDLRGVFPVQ